MCEMSQLVLGSMAKGHELLHRGIESRTLSLSLYYNTLDSVDYLLLVQAVKSIKSASAIIA